MHVHLDGSDEESSEQPNTIKTSTAVAKTSKITATTLTATPITMTTAFVWWPWTSSTTVPTRSSAFESRNTFSFRCLLNRQCAAIDVNSHCTLFGRCVCNNGYRLTIINQEQRCVLQINVDEDCD